MNIIGIILFIFITFILFPAIHGTCKDAWGYWKHDIFGL